MSGDEEQNIIQELNARFQELRTLMITIGSVIAMLLAGLNEVGFINFAVDTVVDWVEDDPDLNPYLGECEEDWRLITDHYIIEDNALFSVHLMDIQWCNSVHTIHYNVTMDGQTEGGESQEFRNEHEFVVTISNISEGTHRAYVEVTNGSIALFESLTIDFEYDEFEMEDAVYGCTNATALNYNESATHDDGSCEYPEEEEEITEDCYAYIYDAISYWAENNTSVYNEFDVDFSCQANVTFTMQVELLDSRNNSLLYMEDNFTTYHMEWDTKYLDFYDIAERYEESYGVNFNLYYDGELSDTLWTQII
tara:strand:- start:381 stop:1304 length:924 start_codon:yes stop_codon:yes gene_type:complete